MPGKMDSRGSQIANGECLVIIKELVKNTSVLLTGKSVSFPEEGLHLLNALADADQRLKALAFKKTFLDIRCSRKMVCVRVRLENLVDFVALLSG